jgi:hypothetical protein
MNTEISVFTGYIHGSLYTKHFIEEKYNMTYTFDQLDNMTVADLRKIADGIDHEAVHGHSTMHKEKLVPALCKALNIDTHLHHKAVGINKTTVKMEIRSWKKKRVEALEKKDYVKLGEIRQHIHDLKGKLRRSIV